MDFLINLIGWFCGFFLLFRVPQCRENPARGKNERDVSLIIPTRNEATVLPQLLDSLARQPIQPCEVIVVDESSDATASIARERGARVIEVKETPAGWMGKSWACYQGALAARGGGLCFLDADTFFDNDGLKKLIDTFEDGHPVLSVQPYHSTTRLYEQLSAFFNVVLMAGIGAFSPFGAAVKPAGAFGPCLVLSRADYLKAGGHEKIKNDIVEDMALGKNLIKAGAIIGLYGGRGTLSFRMYPDGLKQLINGWSKGFGRGAAGTNPLFLLMIILWISAGFGIFRGLLGSFSAVEPGAALTPFLLYTGYAIHLYWILRRIGSFKLITALVYPVPLLFFTLVFAYSVFNIFVLKRVKWKDKSIDLRGNGS
jgi:4,4'-diaponeurosporenoate glycosyltransferase